MRLLLTRGRGAALVLLGVIVVAAGSGALRLRVDPSNRSMHARRPAEAAIDRELVRAFGSTDEILVAVAHPDPLGREGLALLERLTRELSRLAGVTRATSLVNARAIVRGDRGAELAPLLPPRPRTPRAVEAALDRNDYLEGLLFSADREITAIVVEPADVEGPAFRELVADLRATLARETRGGVAIHATGLPLQKHDVARLVDRDQVVLVPACLLVIAVLLAAVFRRVSGVLLPLAVTGTSLAITMGAYGWSGLALNPITSLLPPVVLVLSVTTSVHLYRGWLTADAALADPIERALDTLDRLAVPCFFAAATTALGLASLAIAETPAVRHFGIFAALGALVSFAVAMVVVPIGLARIPSPAGVPAIARSRALAAVAESSARRPLAVVLVATALTGVAAVGIPRIASDTNLIAFLPDSEPLVRDTQFIDRRLTGANVIELMVSRRDGEAFGEIESFRRIERLVETIRGEPSVTGVLSVLPILERVHGATAGESGLPDSDAELERSLDLLAVGEESGLLRRIVDPGFARLRLRVAVRAIGSAEAAGLLERVLARGGEILGDDLRLVAGGGFVRFALDSNRIVRTQIESFALAFGLVFLAIAALLRAPRLTALALVPNLMPVVWTAGLMGALGIELSTGTVMIASVVLGLVVDDTIHYLAHYSRERRSVGTAEAVRRTTTGVGFALVVSTVVLAGGFFVGALGSFRPAVHFSILTGVTMTTALACDLLLLPALLVLGSRGEAS